MAAKINWHRYGTKVRHCHLMYRLTLELHYFAPASALGMIELFGRTESPISREGAVWWRNLALNKITRGPELPEYSLNCTKFGKLFLGKVNKTVANRCRIVKLKCTEFYFGWSFAPHPAQSLRITALSSTMYHECNLRV